MKRLFYLAALLIIVSCQPSRITHSWVADNAYPQQYKKVLVLGVLTDTEKELQAKIEDHLAGDLVNLGYNAFAANKIFPAGTFVKGDSARAFAAINSKDFDAVITIVLLNKSKEPSFVPGKTIPASQINYYNRFDRYINEMNDRIYTPGYYAEDTKFIWECNFYDLAGNEMMYSAQTRTFDHASKSVLAHTFGLLLSDDMVKKNILIKPPKKEE